MKPFMYGSHYSNAGFVLFFLLRLQPFTRLALNLQGTGAFDCPDRLFFSVPETWRGVLNSMSDVKELIPEYVLRPVFPFHSISFFFLFVLSLLIHAISSMQVVYNARYVPQ